MRPNLKWLIAIAAPLLATVAFAPVPALAQDQDNSPSDQATDVNHSSQDATQAPSDDQAKDLSNQGFDTPNNDPAPPPPPPSAPPPSSPN